MTTEFSTPSPVTTAPTDQEIVADLMSEMSATTETQNNAAAMLEEQRRLAWERDRAAIKDFFDNPGKYISAFWQLYKPIVVMLGIVAIVLIAVNFLLSLIGFIVGIPLLGTLLELIGIGYSVWFAQRYFLTAAARQELSEKFEQVKQGIIGTTEEVVNEMGLDAE